MEVGLGGFLPTISPSITQSTAAASSAPAAGAAQAAAAAYGGAAQGAAGASASGGTDPAIAQERATANVMNDRFAQDCQTCKSRKYQDGSDDAGVSFQTPTHIDPGASASAVASHEQEHVSRNKAKAEAEGGEVVSSTVVLHGDICPECGRYYIAGGTTYTTTRHGGHNTQNDMARQAENGGGLDMSV